ncbi:hypothetical protein ACR6C2_35130 [Streptomyces sp. INA 01156]
MRTRAAIIAARLLVFCPAQAAAGHGGVSPRSRTGHRRAGHRRPGVRTRGEPRPQRPARLPARSVSVALLCRLLGVWPTWCVGTRTAPRSRHMPGSRRKANWSVSGGVQRLCATDERATPRVPEPADAAGVR